MAKLQYSKPMFSIRQIPLAGAAGTAGGCRSSINAADGSCVIIEEEMGITIFSDSNGLCDVEPPEGYLCYTVPTADANIYNS